MSRGDAKRLVRGTLAASVAGALVAMFAAGCVSGWHPRLAPVVRSHIPVPSVLPTVTVELPGPTRPDPDADGIKIATYLGDETRTYYGEGPVPERLQLIWRAHIGSGLTGGTGNSSNATGTPGVPAGMVRWSGTGWTGQPALVREDGRLWLLVGGLDHELVRIDAKTGEERWAYAFDDVIKGSPVVFEDPDAPGDPARYVVMCGSRRGFPRSMAAPDIAPVRAVSFATGEELWRLPVPRTRSYSRDADASGFVLDGVAYVAVESGYLYRLDPFETEPWREHRAPRILSSALLLGDRRSARHGGNLVLESSPMLLGDRVYIASGSGHVYGLDRDTLEVEWDYFIGSDLDGTVVPTRDGCLLVPVEKQYIPGPGGLLKLDPRKPPAEALVWFLPVRDRAFADWQGGIIGSPSVGDAYDPAGKRPAIAACVGIDGVLRLVSQDVLAPERVTGPNLERGLPTPVTIFTDHIGGSISTPIIVDDHIVAAGYDAKVHVYRIEYTPGGDGPGVALPNANGELVSVSVREVASFKGGGVFESTPIVWQGRIFVGSRDGYLYCIGDPTLVR